MGITQVEWWDEDPGHCPTCRTKWEWVRPGKSQPICRCYEICSVHGPGKIINHREGEFKGISGYFCAECWEE